MSSEASERIILWVLCHRSKWVVLFFWWCCFAAQNIPLNRANLKSQMAIRGISCKYRDLECGVL